MACDSCWKNLFNFCEGHEPIITIFVTLGSFFWYFVDIATDLVLAVQYYRDGDYVWFGLTLSFVIFASIVMNTIVAIESFSNGKIWKMCFLFLTQTGPAFMYIFPVLDGRCAICRTNSIARANLEPAHLHTKAIVRLMEAFYEAAPQLLLQLYIGFRLFTNGHHGKGLAPNATDVPVTIGEHETLQSTMMYVSTTPSFEALRNISKTVTEVASEEFDVKVWLTSTEGLWWVLSCSTSAITLAWGMSSYYRVLHQVGRFKTKVTIPGTVPIFLWQFLTLTSRIFAMALFATVTPVGFVVLTIAHLMVMITWVLCGDVQLSELVKSKLGNGLIIAPVCIFGLFFPYVQRDSANVTPRREGIIGQECPTGKEGPTGQEGSIGQDSHTGKEDPTDQKGPTVPEGPRSRGSYLMFDCLMYTEILFMALWWFFNTPWSCDSCKIGLLVYILTSYQLGVLCQGLYYGLCRKVREDDHPSCCGRLNFRYVHVVPDINV